MSEVTASRTLKEALESGRNETLPLVSVILPVYNDAESLRRCLHSLRAQTYPADRFEVIVVDNGSTKDNPRAVVAEFSGYHCSVETKVGSYAARNRGISLAKGEIYAFIDSDCIASPQWLEEGARALLAHPECGIVGGRVDIFVQDPAHPSSVELFDRVHAFRVKEWIEQEHKCVTGNMFVWSKVFNTVGLFNEDFKSTGDTEWSGRVHAAGLKLIYDDKASLQHPARRTWRQIITKHRRVAGGRRLLNLQRNGTGHRTGIFQKIYRAIFPSIVGIRKYCSDNRLNGRSERLRFAMVFVIIHYIRLLEAIRLMLGGKATRS